MRKPDRLATVLRVRELTERRRLAEQVAALRSAEAARADHAAARAARRDADIVPGTSLVPHQLQSARVSGIALDEVVESASGDERSAELAAVAAQRALIAASIDRRSAERLRERRAAAAAREAQRLDLRRADDIALQQWRARSWA